MKTFRQYIAEVYWHDIQSPEWGFIKPDGSILNGNKIIKKDKAFHDDLAYQVFNQDTDDLMTDGCVRFATLRNGEGLFSIKHNVTRGLKIIRQYLEKTKYIWGEVNIDIWNDEDETNTGRWPTAHEALRAIATAIRTGDFDHWSKGQGYLEHRYER